MRRTVAWLATLLAAACSAPPAGVTPIAAPGGCPGGERPPGFAERGIGGTGIVGVITGFASICIAGLEVAVDADTKVSGDLPGLTAAGLRVGHVVSIEAEGNGRLRAATVVQRHAVSGPVEQVQRVGDTVTVAGQTVRVPGSAWAAPDLRPGDWVDVSGMPLPDGSIQASRLDPRMPGAIILRGLLQGDAGGGAHIGGTRVKLTTGQSDLLGRFVVANGRYLGDTLVADRVLADLLASSPPSYFGGNVRQLVIQSYAKVVADRAQLVGGFSVPLTPGVTMGPGAAAAPVVITVDQRGDGGVVATGVRSAPTVTVLPGVSIPRQIPSSPPVDGLSGPPVRGGGYLRRLRDGNAHSR